MKNKSWKFNKDLYFKNNRIISDRAMKDYYMGIPYNLFFKAIEHEYNYRTFYRIIGLMIWKLRLSIQCIQLIKK